MITAENLTKRYHQHLAVDDVSFTCEPGTVTGFLGPNGAGKSTTLRMLTGLTPPTSGRVSIDGRPYAELPNPGRLIGVMLDAAAQHPGRTGLETLRITAQLLDLPRSRADEMLDRVGLAGAGKRRVGNYSLGMRQRLGIGSALIGDPAVLVLDEPANGMDPEGIRWMRELLRDFAARGGTVLLSSHLLGEVQATVDRLVVIGNGRIVANGSLEELLAGGRTVVRGAGRRRAGRTCCAAPVTTSSSIGGGGITVDATAEQVGRLAAASGQVLLELRDGGAAGLEDLFFSLTSRGRRGRAGRMTPPVSTPSSFRSVNHCPQRTVMSTALATTATPLTSRNPIRPQRLSTLLRVELRKLVDTRSGKAILGIGVAIPLAALVWMLFKGSERGRVLAVLLTVPARPRADDSADRAVRDDRRMDPADRPDHLHALAAPGSGAGHEVRGRVRVVDGRAGGRGRDDGRCGRARRADHRGDTVVRVPRHRPARAWSS